MPRNERGQFTRNDISIPLPSLGGLYRILIIGILIFPWYAILKNKDYSTTLFSSILGTEHCPICPTCPTCSECPICPECPILPPQKCPIPQECVCHCPDCRPNGSNSSENLK